MSETVFWLKFGLISSLFDDMFQRLVAFYGLISYNKAISELKMLIRLSAKFDITLERPVPDVAWLGLVMKFHEPKQKLMLCGI